MRSEHNFDDPNSIYVFVPMAIPSRFDRLTKQELLKLAKLLRLNNVSRSLNREEIIWFIVDFIKSDQQRNVREALGIPETNPIIGS